jgi:glycosyltransferase involved in cell wall biosynthesis
LRDQISGVLVSVIIPAFNEAEGIARTVRSVLVEQTDLMRVEVLVVDDGSTDDTADLARAAGAKVIPAGGEGGSPAAARNAGVRAASGNPLIFLDADCEVMEGWLSAFMRAYLSGEKVIAGSLDMPDGLNLTAQSDYYCGWYVAHSRRPAGYVPHAPAPNICVDREAFLSTEGFDELPFSMACEERAWQGELRSRGIPIYFEPAARVLHHNRPGFGNLLTRNYRWGYASIGSKHDTGTARLAWLYSYPLLTVAASFPLALVQMIYILVCWARAREFRPFLLMPWLFASRVAYAIGMTAGGISWIRSNSESKEEIRKADDRRVT